MNVIAGQFAALTVASLFYCYREYQSRACQKARRLRERVTYMLWAAAQSITE